MLRSDRCNDEDDPDDVASTTHALGIRVRGLYPIRSVLTLSQSVSESHNLFPQSHFGLIPFHVRMSQSGCTAWSMASDWTYAMTQMT